MILKTCSFYLQFIRRAKRNAVIKLCRHREIFHYLMFGKSVCSRHEGKFIKMVVFGVANRLSRCTSLSINLCLPWACFHHEGKFHTSQYKSISSLGLLLLWRISKTIVLFRIAYRFSSCTPFSINLFLSLCWRWRNPEATKQPSTKALQSVCFFILLKWYLKKIH